MNSKKLTIIASTLTILISLFIIFNQQGKVNNTNTKNTTSNSTTSNTTSKTFKDNKTIELEPVLKENWDYKEKVFSPAQQGTTNFPTKGLSGTREYIFPLGSNNPQYELNILNTNLPTTPENINYVSKFIKSATDLKQAYVYNNNSTIPDLSELIIPFTDVTDFRLYNKLFNKEIEYTKPPEFQEFKVFLSKDGNGNPLSPTLNIIGKIGNDYFLLTNFLRDISTQAIFNQAIKECGQTTDNCVASKADKAIETQLTNEFVDSNIKSMIKTLKF
jgi:hypothetical protein